MIQILATILAALAGLAFGSFLNVCLSRWPTGESIVKPRSHCRACKRTLTWWENVPLVSWLALRGRCRTCNAAIPWRYPLVEFAVAALWAVSTWLTVGWMENPLGSTPSVQSLLVELIGKCILFWLLIALAVLDAENFWLPNFLTWPGILLGFAYSLLPSYFIDRLPLTGMQRPSIASLALHTAVACAISALVILVIRWTYWLLRRREGLGLGDATLMALLAAWLGLPGAILSFVIGVGLGAIVALAVISRASRDGHEESAGQLRLPLGTFLCIGGIVSGLWGPQVVAAYLRWSGLA